MSNISAMIAGAAVAYAYIGLPVFLIHMGILLNEIKHSLYSTVHVHVFGQ